VYAAVRREAAALRRGGPPVLLEFTTYRWQEHVGITDDFGEKYRAPREKERARKSDPLKLARAALKRRFAVSDDDFALWEAETRKEVETAVDFAEKSPFPSPDRLEADLFAPA
jgi:pyruvate dehydrogenase E1 component alpha subunit